MTIALILAACLALPLPIRPELTTSGVALVDGFEGGPPAAFDDHEEIPGSRTSIRLSAASDGVQGKALRVAYQVPIDPKVGWAYGGVSVSLQGRKLSAYKVLSFWARLVSGKAPAFRVSLVTLRPKRKWQGFSPSLKGLGGAWKQFKIPLDKYDGFTPDQLDHPHSVDLVMMSDDGVMDFDQLSLETAPLPSERPRAAVPANKVAFEAGWAAWSYGDDAANALGAEEWNRRAAPEQRLRWIFPWAGDLRFKEGKGQLNLQFQKALALRKALGGQAVQVHAMIDGLSRGCEDVADAEWDRLGAAIAAAVDAEPGLAGVHLDIEPWAPDTALLFAAIKRHTTKPVSAAVGAWTKDAFRFTDLLVLMGYDLGKDPAAFGEAARSLYARFMADARECGTPALIGVPALSTHTEFETLDASGKPQGHRMTEFMDQALEAVRLALKPRDPSFRGLSLWAFHSQGGQLGLKDPDWSEPKVITEAMWKKLSGFKRP